MPAAVLDHPIPPSLPTGAGALTDHPSSVMLLVCFLPEPCLASGLANAFVWSFLLCSLTSKSSTRRVAKSSYPS